MRRFTAGFAAGALATYLTVYCALVRFFLKGSK